MPNVSIPSKKNSQLRLYSCLKIHTITVPIKKIKTIRND